MLRLVRQVGSHEIGEPLRAGRGAHVSAAVHVLRRPAVALPGPLLDGLPRQCPAEIVESSREIDTHLNDGGSHQSWRRAARDAAGEASAGESQRSRPAIDSAGLLVAAKSIRGSAVPSSTV